MNRVPFFPIFLHFALFLIGVNNTPESDLISTVEAGLIRRYVPLWNSVVDGFGNHDPGDGRKGQARSAWDILHPGRIFADRLIGESKAREEIEKRVTIALANF